MAHAQAGARLGQHIGGQTHAFLAAGDDHVGLAAADRLAAQVHRFQAGAAHLVDGHGRHFVGQAGEDRGLPGGVLAGAGGEHLAEDHFADRARLHAGVRQQAAHHRFTEFGGGDVREPALEAADGGAGGGDNDHVLHVVLPS